MGEIVVSLRQINPSHKTASGRSCKIGEGNRVSPGVGLINKSKRKRVRSSHQRIFTGGPHVPRIFMQGNACQKARCSLGSGHGDRISIESPEGYGTVLPFARVMFCWIRHAHASFERREDKRRRPKGLMGVDCKFIAKGQSARTLDRQEQ